MLDYFHEWQNFMEMKNGNKTKTKHPKSHKDLQFYPRLYLFHVIVLYN